MIVLLLITIASIVCCYILHFNYQYWKRRGVPGPKPTFLVGNVLENFLMKKSLADLYSEIYYQFPEASLIGIYRASTPSLIIRDPELIKEITVKSFHNFHDNELVIDRKVDPLSGRNPFFTTGEQWKKTRVQLTSGFTSGKMKSVYPLVEEVSKNLVQYIGTIKEKCSNAKEISMRFTLNNVGNVAFGVDAKCFDEKNPEFKQIADRFFNPEGWNSYKLFSISIIPFLAKLVSVKFTPPDVEEKLINIVKEVIQYRQENKTVREDYLNHLQQVPNFDLVDIAAHAAGFFIDGYETSATVMSYFLYELAKNPEAQDKLREEVNEVFSKNNDNLPFDELQKMEYLDACFYESARFHPALGSLNRVCTKPYTYTPKENDTIKKPFVIEAGTTVVLPLYALHRDPKYFDDPDCFKPERFLGENRKNINKYAFLPFGEGPRACLGQRFGILQVKIGVAYVIRSFKISVNQKTPDPLKHEPIFFLTAPKGGIWLDFERID